MRHTRLSLIAVSLFALAGSVWATTLGYYRQPALHGDTLVFMAEGDLWKVPVAGGVATRLTSHPGTESTPAVSPDGKTVAFVGEYEGPAEVYTMPLDGGRPTRRTYEAGRVAVWGWTPDGRVLYSTNVYTTLPNYQLVALDVSKPNTAGEREILPLAQAADGSFNDDGGTLYFTRLAFQGSHTRCYQGGTAQNIWKFAAGEREAQPLTADYAGTSKRPMWWQGRVYFASDRDGTMNLWSMRADGSDLQQHTKHVGWEVATPALEGGRIAYQLGADLHVYDIASGQDRGVAITLDSDFDQTREHWIAKPMDYLTAAHVSPDGERAVLTARGQVFVAPHRQGRLVEAARRPGVRYREARFMPDGKSLLALSDESGEVEFWTLPANGVGEARQLTKDADVLRWEGVPSPDGKWIAHHDKSLRLFVLNVETGESQQIDTAPAEPFDELTWSPDSQWLAYAVQNENLFRVVRVYGVADQTVHAVSTERYESYSPAWSPDGKWLYMLSDRNLKSVVHSPWGSYQPEPYLDKKTKIYQIALVAGLRSPFAPQDELAEAEKEKEKDKDKEKPEKPEKVQPAEKPAPEPAKPDEEVEDDASANPVKGAKVDEPNAPTTTSAPASQPAEKKGGGKDKPPVVKIEFDGLANRLYEVPLSAGNYSSLRVTDKALFWLQEASGDEKSALVGVAIARADLEVKTVAGDVKRYELSADGKKLFFRKGDSLYIVDAAPAPATLEKKDVKLGAWALSVQPREEWRQMYTEAWRLERDYFYDRGMHGLDWKAMHAKYLPLVDRVTTRGELSDVLAQLVSELSALHIFVYGGEMREGPDEIQPSSLGAVLERDVAAGGYRVAHIYESDPDEVERTSPLARPNVEVKAGDVSEMVNGTPTLEVPEIGALLRQKAKQQVLLRVKPAAGGESRDVIVTPLTLDAAADLRYHEWEYTRRRLVDEWSGGQIGYVHLRAMSGNNFTEWAKSYYPVFTRPGLIVDVRHNSGGSIDSWIIGRLLGKAWFFWSQAVGNPPVWNMQYAFRGHVAALCNERTASDGEAFAEGIKRLKIGKVIGTRTWGGEIWLSSSNFLVDKGIATAAENGVFGPEGAWLIEGHGGDPDMVVDNLPHATFKGEDAQLKAAVDYLLKEIKDKPVPPVVVPKHPDKSWKAVGKRS